MKRFILEQSDNEFYISHSGLALIGLCINRFSGMPQQVAGKMRPGSRIRYPTPMCGSSTFRVEFGNQLKSG